MIFSLIQLFKMMYDGILDNCLYHCQRTNAVDYEAQTMKII